MLRRRILSGEYEPGSQLPPQQQLAEEFGVTLMTLRQAVAALEAEGLVWAARGKGTFVSERPVDISVGNLSSFAQQMRSAGISMQTEVLAVDLLQVADVPQAAEALDSEAELCRLTRRRRVNGLPISLQRSFMVRGAGPIEPGEELAGESLYDAIEAATGWIVAEALESITAVGLSTEDAKILEAEEQHPAMLSLRTSINQFMQPFLYDEALLVGGRCSVVANRGSDRLSLDYVLGDSTSSTSSDQ